MDEIWGRVIESDQYLISSIGRLMSFKDRPQGKILKPSFTLDGYEFYRLRHNGIIYTRRAHRLVGLAFIPNPENKPEINHINGIKNDNRVENLEWATGTENQHHAFQMGLKSHFGSKNPKARLVINTQTGIFYDSIMEAADTIHMGHQRLRNVLCGKLKNNTNFIYA